MPGALPALAQLISRFSRELEEVLEDGPCFFSAESFIFVTLPVSGTALVSGIERFVSDVDSCEFRAGRGEGVEVLDERDAGEIAVEIGGVAFAVFRVVEQGVDVVEKSFFGE